MQVNLRRNAKGVLVADLEAPHRDRDQLFDMVMSLSDFAHEKGLTDVSLHLEEVLDTILQRPKRQKLQVVGPAPQGSDLSSMSATKQFTLVTGPKRTQQMTA